MSEIIAFVARIAHKEQQDWIDVLQTLLPQCQVRSIHDLTSLEKTKCEIAIVANPDPDEIKQLPNLIWLHSVWAGVDAMSDLISSDCPFEIVRLIDPNLTQTMSEAVLGWTLYLHRSMYLYQKQQQEKLWQPHHYIEASMRTIGILGLGELGKASAQRLLQNGFQVKGWSRHIKTIEGIETFAERDGLISLVSQSDILVNLLPSTIETTALLNRDVFQHCRNGMSFINFGRGSVIVEEDLLQALDSNRLSHAVLDVFQQEPLQTEHPFWAHEKITVLPHISAPTSIESASQIVASNIQNYLNIGEIPPTVDKQKGY